MRNRSAKGEAPSAVNSHKSLRALAFSCLVGAVVLTAILFLFSILLSVRNIPHLAILPMVLVALIGCGGAAGFCCARLCREKGLLLGSVCGLLMAVLLAAAGSLFGRSLYMPTVPQLLVLLFSGAIGGVLGVNSAGARRIRR